MRIYLLLEENKINIQELYDNLVEKDEKKLEKIASKRISSNTLKKLEENYTKENCLDEILYITDYRYRHLKEIRHLVDISEMIEQVIPSTIYLEKIKVHYTDLILDKILDFFYDIDSVHFMIGWKEELIKIDSDLNRKIIKNMDNYYIKKITI